MSRCHLISSKGGRGSRHPLPSCPRNCRGHRAHGHRRAGKGTCVVCPNAARASIEARAHCCQDLATVDPVAVALAAHEGARDYLGQTVRTRPDQSLMTNQRRGALASQAFTNYKTRTLEKQPSRGELLTIRRWLNA